MIEEIKAAIHAGKNFFITSHVRLDGDALGSELALYLMLKGMGKRAVVCNQDATPEQYRFLPAAEHIVHGVENAHDYDTGFLLDCSEAQRVGNVSTYLSGIKTLINIDHHVSNGGFTRLRILDPQASSTGELLFRLMKQMNVVMTPEICTNLFAAILTDTGGFRYSNTGRDTFRAAGDLVEGGADPQWISENIYQSDSPAKLRLLAAAMETIEIDMQNRIASMTVTFEHLRRAGATMDHTEGFVEVPRTVRGIDISVLYTQMEEGKFKVSLRSKGSVNVEKIAGRFGGGGHINAAACRISGDIDTVKARIYQAVRESL
ncbi:MAG TPA: bifunctional oligoribonuclease/PAP phosphatase NrnA [Smithellaceae bacterium]|jgi:phosphoesterase RecJ-like protein|nr:bifunctional oligoribonuclease/PAP phosphatase NrnA [Syntrophaceae bacterium]HPV48069.1 bifunctional oligoribonuclease/PAP phosphatase NrnA [Smithellaceae bacterium]